MTLGARIRRITRLELERTIRILIVDDEPAVCRAIAQVLNAQGHEVLTALSGEEALALIERSRLDAVFLDIAMPGMNGIEVLRRIRQSDSRLPVIILSGWANQEEIELARELGATDVVFKPAALRHLSDALARLAR